MSKHTWSSGIFPPNSPLIKRQRALVELQDRQVAGRGVDLADRRAGPTAVGVLRALQEGEEALLVAGPGEPLVLLRFGEHPGVAFFAEHVDNLGVIVVGVFGVAELVA